MYLVLRSRYYSRWCTLQVLSIIQNSLCAAIFLKLPGVSFQAEIVHELSFLYEHDRYCTRTVPVADGSLSWMLRRLK
jgi:hypothetical protein